MCDLFTKPPAYSPWDVCVCVAVSREDKRGCVELTCVPLMGIKGWWHILKGFGAHGKHRDLVVYASNLKRVTAQ